MSFVPDSVIVVGSGGIGGHLIPALSRLISYHSAFEGDSAPEVVIVDGDEFEEKNITRQIVSPSDLGKNKAEAMTYFCKYQGLTNVRHIPDYINQEDFERILMECDAPLVISSVDNDATRKAMIDALNKVFSSSGDFFFISPGNSDGVEEVKGQVIWYGRIDDQKYGIDPSLLYDNLQNPLDAIPRSGTCSANAPSQPQLISANFMAASGTLTIVQNLLDNLLSPKSSSFFFNLRTLQTSYS
jgi:hypothetical protein